MLALPLDTKTTLPAAAAEDEDEDEDDDDENDDEAAEAAEYAPTLPAPSLASASMDGLIQRYRSCRSLF